MSIIRVVERSIHAIATSAELKKINMHISQHIEYEIACINSC